MVQRLDLSRWSPLPLRLTVGFGFLAHGLTKLSKGSDAFAAILQQIGVPLPHVAAWLTIGTELLSGGAILLGAFVTWASIPMTIVLLTAIGSVHWHYGFSSVRLLSASPTGAKFGPVGYEIDLLYLAGLAALVMPGGGPLSVDHFLNRWRERPGVDEGSKSSCASSV